jgi:hypothetical protein
MYYTVTSHLPSAFTCCPSLSIRNMIGKKDCINSSTRMSRTGNTTVSSSSFYYETTAWDARSNRGDVLSVIARSVWCRKQSGEGAVSFVLLILSNPRYTSALYIRAVHPYCISVLYIRTIYSHYISACHRMCDVGCNVGMLGRCPS